MNLWKLITPDLEKGDRPFEARPYGRLRLSKEQALFLQDMVKSEIDFLRNNRRVMKDEGASVAEIENNLKVIRKIGDNLLGLLDEKSWR